MPFKEKPKTEEGSDLGGFSRVLIWNFEFEISIGRISGDIKEQVNMQVWRSPVWIYNLQVVSI